MHLQRYFRLLEKHTTHAVRGHVLEANNQCVVSAGPPCSLGDCCEVMSAGGIRHNVEVIGFRGRQVLSMPVASSSGIRFGDQVLSVGGPVRLSAGMQMLGRVLDANGTPIDGEEPFPEEVSLPLDRDAPAPLSRTRIHKSLGVGVRVIDTMLTVARGQRIGLFGGSGAGKSTLLGMMTRNTEADLTVVGLVGERGREVREFLEDSLGAEGRKRSVMHVSTSDESPIMRLRCAQAATASAEYFASQGKHVLLILDSLTRYAMAAREVGLAAGEPPSTKGYPPSVIVRLARLLERAGSFAHGSITGFYTVLMEGDDEQDPIVDTARSILDGHVMLSRDLAGAGVYPPIDVLRSLSRLMPAVASAAHQADARRARNVLGAYTRNEDLLRVGAYRHGSDQELDEAIRLRPAMLALFQQGTREPSTLEAAVECLASVMAGA